MSAISVASSATPPQENLLTNDLRKKFSFSPAEEAFLKKINRVFFDQDLIRAHAAALQENREALEQKQHSLLKIVYLSRELEEVKIAASNAISILNATSSSFSRLNLEGIRIPYAKLSHGLFDEANLTGSELTEVEFSASSLRNAVLDKSSMQGVRFGSPPFLLHDDLVLAAVKAAHSNRLASNDSKNMCLWDLQTMECQRAEVERYEYSLNSFDSSYYPSVFLLFSFDEQFLFRIHGKGVIDIWKANPLNKVGSLKLANTQSFKMAKLSPDGKYLTLVRSKPPEKEPEPEGGQEISVLEFTANKDSPKLRLLRSVPISDCVEDFYLFSQEIGVVVGKKAIQFFSYPHLKLQKTSSLSLRDADKYRDFQFTADGKNLLFVKGDQVFAWNLKDKNQTLVFSTKDAKGINNASLYKLQQIPNTNLIIYSTYTETTDFICVQDIQGALKAQIPCLRDLNIATRVFSDGAQFFKVEDRRITISSIEDLSIEQHVPIGSRIISTVFPPDNQSFMFINDLGELHQYNALSGQEQTTFQRKLNQHVVKLSADLISRWEGNEHVSNPYYRSLSPDARYIVGGASILKGGKVWLGETKNGQFDRELDVPCYIAYALSRDGRHLIFLRKDQLEIYELPSGKSLSFVQVQNPFTEQQVDFAISPIVYPITYAAIAEKGSGKSSIWQIDWEKHVIKRVISFRFPLFKMRFVTDQELVWCGADAKSLWRWDSRIAREFYFSNFIEAEAEILAFDIIPNEALAVICTAQDQEIWIQVKNFKTNKQIAQLKTSLSPSQGSISVAPNGRLICCWNSEAIHMFEFSNEKLRLLWKLPQKLDTEGISVKDAKLDAHSSLPLSQFNTEAPNKKPVSATLSLATEHLLHKTKILHRRSVKFADYLNSDDDVVGQQDTVTKNSRKDKSIKTSGKLFEAPEIEKRRSQALEAYFEGDLQSLSDYATQQLVTAIHAREKEQESEAYKLLGNALLRQRRYEEAIASFENGLKFYEEEPEKYYRERIDLYISIGNTYQEKKDFKKAKKRYETASKIADQIEASFSTACLFFNRGILFDRTGELNLAQNHRKEALKICCGLRDELASSRVDRFDDLNFNMRQVLSEKLLIASNDLDKALDSVEQKHSQFLRLSLSKKYKGIKRNENLTEIDIQELAEDQNTTFVVYSFDGVYAISASQFEWKPLTVSLYAYEKEAEDLLQTISALASSDGKALVHTQPVLLARLRRQLADWYKKLILPVEEFLPKDSRETLTIVPDRFLAQLPFALFQDAQGKYLIEKCPIRFAPSIQTSDLWAQTSEEEKIELLAIGDALSAKEEYPSIAQFSPNLPQIQPTVEETLQQIATSRWVHLACQGESGAKEIPTSIFEGRLKLSPSSQFPDGYLAAREVAKTVLRTDLVFISRYWDTTLNLRANRMDFRMAFLAAGAASVVAPLWQPRDTELTTQIIHEFYKVLPEKKMNKAQALQAAMLIGLEKEPESPHLWGNFYLSGQL